MSTVLKAGETPRARLQLRNLELVDHVQEARAILDRARADADAIRRQAMAEATELRRAAAEEGRRHGFAEGLEQGRTEGKERAYQEAMAKFDASHRDTLSCLQTAVARFEKQKENLLIGAKKDALDLSLAIAERITLRIGAVDRSIAARQVEAAIDITGTSSDVRIRVHPADLETLQTFADDRVREWTRLKHIRFEPDESMAPGGCMVDSPNTTVDARLDQQFQEIAELLIGARPLDLESAPADAVDGPVNEEAPEA